ncbi:hypothetical protein BU24DRAFT_449677 [Aaosphaeria arxii CBS 175.79]|uniref:Uncharacterized protein n=1 Tax=Aaosphaeria arxii CBS 175.79 TaxID=1450172 RepID=A0A6A5XYW1_9PLEO|nr:uncharacterized protein BU24DRAFT_449677 [Aaosphaeria arxii CBS 175.79]KAF2018159.1 hypothetical protein BU24DRAFT_449677 [Aaosphaeria arxii CBS 175.79]
MSMGPEIVSSQFRFCLHNEHLNFDSAMASFHHWPPTRGEDNESVSRKPDSVHFIKIFYFRDQDILLAVPVCILVVLAAVVHLSNTLLMGIPSSFSFFDPFSLNPLPKPDKPIQAHAISQPSKNRQTTKNMPYIHPIRQTQSAPKHTRAKSGAKPPNRKQRETRQTMSEVEAEAEAEAEH